MQEKTIDRKKMIKKIGLIFVIVVILLTFFSKTINNFLMPEVDYTIPYSGYLKNEILATGEVKTLNTVSISSYGRWKIIDVNVEEGAMVKKGDVLATVNEEDILIDIHKKEIEIEILETEIKRFIDHFENIELPSYNDTLNQTSESVENEKENVEYNSFLFNSGAISQTELKKVKNAYDKAEKDYLKNKETIIQKKSQYEYLLKEKNLSLKLKKIDLEDMKKIIPIDGQILSPSDCEVLTVNVDSGNIKNKNEVMFELSGENAQKSIIWYSTNEKASNIKIGDLVEAEIYEPERLVFEGIVNERKYLSKEGRYFFTSYLENIQINIPDGQEVNISVVKKSRDYDMIVPKTAVKEADDKKVVYVLREKEGVLGTENYLEMVIVEIYESDDINTAISGALKRDDKIVTYSTKAISAGVQVKKR